MKEFLSCLPESYRNSPETVDLLRVIQEAAGLLREQSHSFLQQAQVSTASWGCPCGRIGTAFPWMFPNPSRSDGKCCMPGCGPLAASPRP